MVKNNINLQDIFLNYARKEEIQITIYLLNGYQLKGSVKGFDNYTIVIQTIDHKQQLIYKHAISTISPIKPIKIPNRNNMAE
ncbi:RNA chaperone Hfq [Garciella nitratireducens]|uniref:RNA chaperone Hfq n=1 Tax=Garciella nitratireducens TaxID=218205 RepID=UPI000DE87C1D|nr:RNA chaperone Hfq [Garciella nitratireducens]RBP45605.1 RNA-binding protein Hfq [Garciella nitratireducens]